MNHRGTETQRLAQSGEGVLLNISVPLCLCGEPFFWINGATHMDVIKTTLAAATLVWEASAG